MASLKNFTGHLLLFAIALLLISGCEEPDVIHNLGNKSNILVNQQGDTVRFPADFRGQHLVIGFIYTHCPDICPVTTANMKQAYSQLKDTADVEFVGISFDPARDTPAVLRQYMHNFKLPADHFTMLTGDSASVESVLRRMGVEAAISYRDTTAEGTVNYFMKHTDRISIMDIRGRVRFEYPGSVVPPEHLVEDLNKLR